MQFVEVYFDAEQTCKWCITVWTITEKDFDPFESSFINVEDTYNTVTEAILAQNSIVAELKKQGEKTYQNYIDSDAYFWIRPKWLENLCAAVKGAKNGQNTVKERVHSSKS